MDSNLGGAMISTPQPRNKLENRRGKDDEMPRRVWKAVETDSGKIRVAETKRREGKRRNGKKTRKKGRKEEAKKRKNSRSKNSSRRMENMK